MGNPNSFRSPVRIAIVSTPRAGNTWLRNLLARTYDVPQLAVHSMTEKEWDQLPERCVFQMHTHHTEETRARFDRLGFRVITLARHPLDVLISILHFALYEPEVARWLEGEAGNEQGILLVQPSTREFLTYACSDRARVLLGISREWWNLPGCVSVRYEDLVTNTSTWLGRIVEALGWSPAVSTLDEAITACSMNSMRKMAHNNHFWKGQPGAWKAFLTQEVAKVVADTHRDIFATIGYSCEPSPTLTADEANRRWLEIVQKEWWEFVQKNITLRQELASVRAELHQIKSQRWTLVDSIPATQDGNRPQDGLLVRLFRKLRQSA